MRPKKLCMALVFVILVSVINSCAGIPFFSGARQEFEQGLAKFNVGKYEEAIPHFSKATELDSEYAEAYLYLGRSYLSLQRWSEAIPPLRTAYRLSPGETRKEALNLLFDAVMGAAGHEFRNGNFRSSVEYLKEAIKLAPSSGRAKTELMKSLMALGGKSISDGNLKDAISAYKDILELSPNYFDAYLGIAKAFFKSGDYERALEAAKKALELHPSSDEAMSLIRQLLLRR